jgi:hypothetical protein
LVTWEACSAESLSNPLLKLATRFEDAGENIAAFLTSALQGRDISLTDIQFANRARNASLNFKDGFGAFDGQTKGPEPIVQAEDDAKKLEGIYDQIEEEQKKSAERIAAWREQVREQELEKEYRDIGKQIEREEKERMEAERKMADEAEKMAREVSRVRERAGREAANAWDSNGGGMGAAPLAVMGTAEQQLASYQASRARDNAAQRADFIRNAIREALNGITVNTNVVQGGVTAAPV